MQRYRIVSFVKPFTCDTAVYIYKRIDICSKLKMVPSLAYICSQWVTFAQTRGAVRQILSWVGCLSFWPRSCNEGPLTWSTIAAQPKNGLKVNSRQLFLPFFKQWNDLRLYTECSIVRERTAVYPHDNNLKPFCEYVRC